MNSRGLVAAVLVMGFLIGGVAWAADTTAGEVAVFQGDAAGRALWDKMLQTMREAKTLQWESQYRWEAEGREISHCTYRMWLKKPDLARIEVLGKKGPEGVLVLDGTYRWIYWPGGKPRYGYEKDDKAYERVKRTSYMKEQAAARTYSLWHQTDKMGGGMNAPVLEPSYFHGSTSSLDGYLDGVRSIGEWGDGGETLDGIEVSFMKHQRSYYLWLSRRDHLPRKLQETVRVEYEITSHETWTKVKVNEPIDDARFQWAPAKDWTEFRLPQFEEGLLKPGTVAPDFDMAGLDGGRMKLSDYRGQVVWLNVWRVGCPPCRDEMPAMEELHQQYGTKGLALLGVNVSDDVKIAAQFLQETGATFPNAVDSSKPAQQVVFEQYQTIEGFAAVPMHYLIDREGKVFDAWYGDDMDRAKAGLAKLGLGGEQQKP